MQVAVLVGTSSGIAYINSPTQSHLYHTELYWVQSSASHRLLSTMTLATQDKVTAYVLYNEVHCCQCMLLLYIILNGQIWLCQVSWILVPGIQEIEFQKFLKLEYNTCTHYFCWKLSSVTYCIPSLQLIPSVLQRLQQLLVTVTQLQAVWIGHQQMLTLLIYHTMLEKHMIQYVQIKFVIFKQAMNWMSITITQLYINNVLRINSWE